VSDLVAAVWRRRYLVLSFLTVATAGALMLQLILPPTYESSASVVSQKEDGSGLLGGLARVTGQVPQMPGVSLPSYAPNRDLLVGVMKSRTIGQAVVQQFNLQERYRSRYQEDAVRKLRESTTISVSREGVISITVEDRDPRLAASMANFYVTQLDKLVTQFGVGEAGRQRLFLTEQAARANADLRRSEDALRQFQENNRAVVLQEQTRGAIESAARLKAEIVAAEVQLQVVRRFATDANPEVVTLMRRIDAMRAQLAQMQDGDGPARIPVGDRKDFSLPFTRVPGLSVELARLTREVKVQEALVTLLVQQLEQAKIGEAKNTTIVQVLDWAVPAERPSRPRLGLNLAVSIVVSLSLALGAALALERVGAR
jgi:uncharacterized protein involved in exopolysaccharide biosynthesis